MNFHFSNDAFFAPIAGKAREDDRSMAVLLEVFSESKIFGVSGVILAEKGQWCPLIHPTACNSGSCNQRLLPSASTGFTSAARSPPLSVTPAIP